jgi:thioredoxin-like negative regulator of GroEL
MLAGQCSETGELIPAACAGRDELGPKRYEDRTMRRHISLFGFLVAWAAILAIGAPVYAQDGPVGGGRRRPQNRRVVQEEVELERPQDERSLVGKEFPVFRAKHAVTGEPFSLKDLRGQIVLIDFWATWCRPCIVELPNIKKAYAEYHDKGFEIVSISLDRTSDIGKCKSFVEQENMSWYQVIEGGFWDARLAKQYNIRSIPAMFLLDANGVVVTDRARGERLARAIEEAMEKTPPTSGAKLALEQAEELLAKKDYIAALEAFEAVAKKHKGTDEARAAQQHIEEMTTDKEIVTAIKEIKAKKAEAKKQRETANWLRMARSLAKAGRYEAAKKNYKRIIDKYPDSEEAQTAELEMNDLP